MVSGLREDANKLFMESQVEPVFFTQFVVGIEVTLEDFPVGLNEDRRVNDEDVVWERKGASSMGGEVESNLEERVFYRIWKADELGNLNWGWNR